MLFSYLFLRQREREIETEEGGTDLYAFLLLSSTLAPIGSVAKNKSDSAVYGDLGQPELRID